jgi:DNA mismatch repair protein MutL
MGKIHVLSDNVANKIAAGEVVERPASVVKELLENSLDAGATRIRIQVEAGGKRLIQISDNGCGMVRDDALLAFERHATSKINRAEDLLSVATLGFRGEALPSIAAVSRLRLQTRAPEEPSGTEIEIHGGRIQKVEEAGLPVGTLLTVRDLFFNTPARRKFLKSESTELSHVASLVTHYALAHPDKHLELHSATHAMLVAPPVGGSRDRIYQIFGKDVLEQLLRVAEVRHWGQIGSIAESPERWDPEERAGTELAAYDDEPDRAASGGEFRVHGFVSKPEVQKLNRNSIYVFVNRRLIRDRVIQHALSEAYRNIIPPTVYPVVLLFLELPNGEVDVNVHPSKTEVRFRRQAMIHDLVRDSVRAALIEARPVPQFTTEMRAHPTATPSLAAVPRSWPPASAGYALDRASDEPPFSLQAIGPPPLNERLEFDGGIGLAVDADDAIAWRTQGLRETVSSDGCTLPIPDDPPAASPLVSSLFSLKPLGQIRDSFILAVNHEGLWIIDQHVAHERVLFERVLEQRATQTILSQRLLVPLVFELTPGQQAVFAEISEELQHNGFEAEPFGASSVAVKVAPAGIEPTEIERMLEELLDQCSREQQALNMEKLRTRIAASIACHAAIKVNTALEQSKMEWLLAELAKTECPMSCPHGRPVVLRYSLKDIQKAFKRI